MHELIPTVCWAARLKCSLLLVFPALAMLPKHPSTCAIIPEEEEVAAVSPSWPWSRQVPCCQLAPVPGALSLGTGHFTTPNSFLTQQLWLTAVFSQVWGCAKSESLFAVPCYSSLPDE